MPEPHVDQSALVPKPTGVNQRAAVAMDEAELDDFLRGNHTLTLSTFGIDHTIHSVAMWYGYIDGTIHMEAKRKSQKVKNLERDPSFTISIHDGYLYDEMRGVMLRGRAEVLEDDDLMRRIVHDVFGRYHGIDDPDEGLITPMIRNRVIIRLDVDKVASWDHRKLSR